MQLVSLGRFQLEPDAYPRPKLLPLVCYLALEGGRSREHLRTLFGLRQRTPVPACESPWRN